MTSPTLRAGFNQVLLSQSPITNLKVPSAPGVRAGFIVKVSRRHASQAAYK